MSGAEIEAESADRITPFHIHAYDQRREDWQITHVDADFDTIQRVAATISPEIHVEKAGRKVKWSYRDKPPIYISEDGLYSHSHSLEAHENAARVISILKAKGHAAATRLPSKKFRVLNDPAREMIEKNALRKKDKQVLHYLAAVGPILVGDPTGLLTEKHAKRLVKKGLIVLKTGESGRQWAEASPDKKRVERIIYRGFDEPKQEEKMV